MNVYQTQLKEDVLFARYGGEEFVLALKGRTGLEGEMLANQLRKSIEIEPLMTTEGVIPVTFSSGVAEAVKEETLYQLLNKAVKLYTLQNEKDVI
ncbi:GGDEF domain-containing protein [Neobacillus drentensis]|uniref:GGDEF domain-containing protein n=1 Tax=Neobacillus drentensis TaxID=220684 RepID=UPI003001E7C6